MTDQIGSAPLGASTYSLSAQDGLVWSAIRFHPGLPIKNTDGTYSSSQISSEFGDINNPIFTIDNQDRQSTRVRIFGSVNGDLEIVKGLHAKANIAVDANFNDSHEFKIIVLDQIRTNSRNSLTVQDEKNYSVLQEYFLSYDKQIGIHTFGIIGGYSQQTFNYSSNRNNAMIFPAKIPANVTLVPVRQSQIPMANVHTMVFNPSLSAEHTISTISIWRHLHFRRDGSSKFGPNNRWANFPAFSVGWRISEELFRVLTNIVSSLKLTGGWGQLGNQNIERLQYLALISSGYRYSFGDQPTVGSAQSQHCQS